MESSKRRLMPSRVLLTGGTGFFGRSLIRYLSGLPKQQENSVVILSRDPRRFMSLYPDLASSDALQFLQADIQDRSSLPWDESFSHILHAATDSTTGPLLSPIRRYQQITEGTLNVLDLAVATGADRFLLTSSGAIYGPQPDYLEAFPEDWPGSPSLNDIHSAYGQGKRAAEHICALYREMHQLQIIVARCFAFVGPDLPLDVHFAIGNFISDALFSDEIFVKGDGSPLRTFLDQRDLAHWLWFLLHCGNDGEIFNVGSDFVVSIGELAKMVKLLLAPAKSVKFAQNTFSEVRRSRYIPDISRIAKVHGLLPSISLEESIIFAAKMHLS